MTHFENFMANRPQGPANQGPAGPAPGQAPSAMPTPPGQPNPVQNAVTAIDSLLKHMKGSTRPAGNGQPVPHELEALKKRLLQASQATPATPVSPNTPAPPPGPTPAAGQPPAQRSMF